MALRLTYTLLVVIFVGISAEVIDVFIDRKFTEPRSGIQFGPFSIRKETGVNLVGPKQEVTNCGGKEMAFTFRWKPTGTLTIGKTYTFTAETTAAHDMVYGVAYPKLYFNDILLLNTKLFFCDLIPKKYKICPVKKGDKVSVSGEASISASQIQPGHYHGNCTVYNEKNDEMICATLDLTLN